MISTTDPTEDSRPRFEYYPLESTKRATVEIDEFPFVIGRAASASLQINSTSVSREHAAVVRTPTGFCVRDLGSTNGTLVNGQPVRETPLTDGDSLSVADVELTFVCTSMGRLQRTLTKPLQRKNPAVVLPGTPPELASTRSLNEALLLQTIPLKWNYFSEGSSSEVLIASAEVASPLDELMAQADAKLPTSAASRLESLCWQLAAEQVDERSSFGNLLVNLVHRESLNERILETLAEVSDTLNAKRSLGVAVHWEWATSSPDTLRLLGRLRDRGLLLVFDEFSGGSSCIESMEVALPDFLILSSQVVNDTSEVPRRLRRLENVNTACSARGVQVVLPLSVSAKDRQACNDIGIRIGRFDSLPAVSEEPLVAVHA